jgi:hypothetical protein
MKYEIVDKIIDKYDNEVVLDDETVQRLMKMHSSTPRIVYTIYGDESRRDELKAYQDKKLL